MGGGGQRAAQIPRGPSCKREASSPGVPRGHTRQEAGQKSSGWEAAGRPCWVAQVKQVCPRRGGCGLAVHLQCCGRNVSSFLQEVKETVSSHYYDRLLLKL